MSCTPSHYHYTRCAGKKLHDSLSQAACEEDFLVTRFKEECLKHSQLRHPNIVQLLGVHSQPNSHIPMLIMEYMPFTLVECLEKYKDIPVVTKYHILLDVSLGLRFLHEQTPPIIHRDLTANNVMLTADMRAKVADLGQAKIVDLRMTTMTVSPGTLCYMPPEALVQNPIYDMTLDIFSFGVLIIHTAIQEWPTPSEVYTVDPSVPGRLSPLSEIDRRRAFLELMGDSNVLTSLAKQCINNDPRLRPQLVSVISKLEELVSQSQLTYGNSLEAMKMIEESKLRITSLESCLQDAKIQLEVLLQDIQTKASLDQTEISSVEKQLKSISHVVQASLNKQDTKGEGRLAIVYRSSELKECNLPIKIGRSLSGNNQLTCTTVIQPPINISFTGTHCKTILSGLKSPMSVAVSKEGLVYVCDEQGWKAVHIYSPNNTNDIKTMVESASSLESSSSVLDEKCWHPSGIALDQNSNILLSDTDSHRILKFSAKGKLLATAGTKYVKGEGNGEFNKPKGIAVARNGNVFVCDRDNHRVQVLNSELKFMCAFGKHGSGEKCFHQPRDAAFDSAGNIYVVDSSNYCVKVFTPDFKPLRQIGSQGNQYYHFRAPMNICIDSDDFVYVTDRNKHCVMVFDQAGVFKMHFGNYGKRVDGLFDHPTGIAVDVLGHVYICDTFNGCVQMFV